MQTGEIVIYQTLNGETSIDVTLQDESVWLNLNQLSPLFDRDESVISRHISRIFKEKELEPASVVAKNATTGKDRNRTR